MKPKPEIAQVDRVNGEFLIVSFSDGTCKQFRVDTLLAMESDSIEESGEHHPSWH